MNLEVKGEGRTGGPEARHADQSLPGSQNRQGRTSSPKDRHLWQAPPFSHPSHILVNRYLSICTHSPSCAMLAPYILTSKHLPWLGCACTCPSPMSLRVPVQGAYTCVPRPRCAQWVSQPPVGPVYLHEEERRRGLRYTHTAFPGAPGIPGDPRNPMGPCEGERESMTSVLKPVRILLGPGFIWKGPSGMPPISPLFQ